MALFGRDHLPARSTLSRFLAALPEAPVEALRTLFLDDLPSRPFGNDAGEQQTGSLVDRTGIAWVVFDMDGTREAARQRALPKTEDLPPSFRRLNEVCAPGYTHGLRNEIVEALPLLTLCAQSQMWRSKVGAATAVDGAKRGADEGNSGKV